jgi:hypothetical protein
LIDSPTISMHAGWVCIVQYAGGSLQLLDSMCRVKSSLALEAAFIMRQYCGNPFSEAEGDSRRSGEALGMRHEALVVAPSNPEEGYQV